MAGHSKFKNIMHRKGAQDKKRAKTFTKVLKEVVVAAQTGLPDPDLNARLRMAIAAARAVNVPKNKIENAINRGQNSSSDENYEELQYEGYGPHGSALIVEALTDNRNRTASFVRSSFSKMGGNLAEAGSVSYMFAKMGSIFYEKDNVLFDTLLEAALNCGAKDCIEENDGYLVLSDIAQFHLLKDSIVKELGKEPLSTEIIWKPDNQISLDIESAHKLMKLIETLEDNDDVQSVWTNALIPDELQEQD